jgi:predicted negative regulator of RcsB-dependent stress response
MKESTERFMKKNGRWVSATILLGAGAYVAWNAFKSMP